MLYRHYFTSAAFLPLLSAASNSPSEHTGTVINISSISGITSNSQHQFQYNVSKAASIQLTTLLAQEFRRPGVSVRVNSIAPGVFPSEMTSMSCYSMSLLLLIGVFSASESDEHNKSSITSERGHKEGIPAGRVGRDEDMAQAALMLATNQYAYGRVGLPFICCFSAFDIVLVDHCH